MGIGGDWYGFLRKKFEWQPMPDDAVITALITDMSLNIRRVTRGAETYSEIGRRLRNQVLNHLTPSLEVVHIQWDEPEYAPPNKDKERRKRAEKSRVKPFSEKEAAGVRFSTDPEYDALPEPQAEFLDRLMATRSLHAAFNAWCAGQIAMLELPPRRTDELRIMLDGVMGREIANVQLAAADPTQPQVKFTNVRVSATSSYTEDALLDRVGRVYLVVPSRQAPPPSASAAVEEDDGDAVEPPLKRARTSMTSSSSSGEQSPYGSERDDALAASAEKPWSPGPTSAMRYDSSLIGEADLKIMWAIRQLPVGSRVLVVSCDSDMLAIMFIQMRSLMDEGTDNIPYEIYLDTRGPGAKDPPPILDVVAMWRYMQTEIRTLYPLVKRPDLALATLMLLTGSDYTDKYPQLGPVAMWNSFCDQGHKIMFGTPRDHALYVLPVIGDSDTRHPVFVREHRMWSFMAYTYYRTLVKGHPFESEHGGNSLEDARRVAEEKDARAHSEGRKWRVPSDQEIIARMRRVHWTLDYWTNGAGPHMPYFLDPTVSHPDTGLPIHGWYKDTAALPDRRGRQPIEPAGEVHRFSA